MKADLSTLSIAYDDARDKSVKYQIALFAHNLGRSDEYEPDAAEKSCLVDMELIEGLVSEKKDPIIENFPASEPEPNTEADKQLELEEQKLKRLDRDLYDAYIDKRSTSGLGSHSVREPPKMALKNVLTSNTFEKTRERQQNGHPLDE